MVLDPPNTLEQLSTYVYVLSYTCIEIFMECLHEVSLKYLGATIKISAS